MIQYRGLMLSATLLYCFVLCTLNAGALAPLKHKDVHGFLPLPFSLVRPSSFTIATYARKRQKPNRASTRTGTLPPGTAIHIPQSHDFTQPWVEHKGSFIAFDAYAQDTEIISTKVASSSLSWGSSTLTATLEYSDHKNYHFTLTEGNTILMERQRSMRPAKLLDSRPIGLYTIQNKKKAIIGWCVLQSHQLIFAFPYKGDDARLRVFSYHIQCAHPGPIRIANTNRGMTWSYAPHRSENPVIIGETSDTHIDLWGYKTIRLSTPHPTTNFRIPAVYRLTLPSNTPPSLQEISPPEEVKDWPEEALQTWSPVRLFLASLIWNLQTFRSQILCSIPQKFWDYARTADLKDLKAFAIDRGIQELTRFEVDLLKVYLPKTPINLDSLLFVSPPSLQTEKGDTPSKIMVLLDAT